MASLHPGDKLGGFLLVQQLGRGGMGEVWRAANAYGGPDVALKVLLALSSDAGVSIQREIEGLKRAGQHPCVCSFVKSGSDGDVWYVAMELLDGADLSEVLAREGGRLPLERVKAIGGDVLDGLAHLHERKVFHLDVKPANVRVLGSGRAKLMDLGIAKLRSMSRALTMELDQASRCIGTPEYMPPEQWAAEKDEEFGKVDGRSDLYAFGIMLYELVTGELPYTGSTKELMGRHALGDPPRLRLLAAEAPDALEAVYRRLVEKRKEDRFADAAEAKQALDAALRPVARPPPPATIQVPPPRAASAGPETVPVAPPRAPVPRTVPAQVETGPPSRFQLRYTAGGQPHALSVHAGDRAAFGRKRKPAAGESWVDVPEFSLRYLPAADSAMREATQTSVSKRHFDVAIQCGRAMLTDRSSAGTFVDGIRAPPLDVATPLEDGMRVRIGPGPHRLIVPLPSPGEPGIVRIGEGPGPLELRVSIHADQRDGAPAFVLLSREGNGEGHAYLLLRTFATVGSAEDAAVYLDAPGVAPEHAYLVADSSGVILVAPAGDAPLAVNGVLVGPSGAVLPAGAALALGSASIAVQVHAADADRLFD